MNRQQRFPSTQGRRVIPLAGRTAAEKEPLQSQSKSRGKSQTRERDWVAWICLALGILCGAGALYFAISAI